MLSDSLHSIKIGPWDLRLQCYPNLNTWEVIALGYEADGQRRGNLFLTTKDSKVALAMYELAIRRFSAEMGLAAIEQRAPKMWRPSYEAWHKVIPDPYHDD